MTPLLLTSSSPSSSPSPDWKGLSTGFLAAQAAALVLTATFLAIAVAFNVAMVCRILFSRHLRGVGYFSILLVAAAIHVLYFIIEFVVVADKVALSISDPPEAGFYRTLAFTQFEQYLMAFRSALWALWSVSDRVDGSSSSSSADNASSSRSGDNVPGEEAITVCVRHLGFCLLGVLFLLLACATVQCRLASQGSRSRGCIAGCCGVAVVATLLVGAAAFAVVLLAYFNVLYVDPQLRYGKQFPIFLSYAIHVLLFSLFPTFIIVLNGAVNWVSNKNSTKVATHEIELSKLLDRRLCFLASPALLLFLLLSISQFAYDLKVYTFQAVSADDVPMNNQHFMWRTVSMLVYLLMDAILLLIPVMCACTLCQGCACSRER